jgi:hypothetical protein
MKPPTPIRFGLIVYCLCWFRAAQAQVYEPATEYHDPIQRVFVVEAARVLAWWNERGATNLAEVTYDVTTKADQSTVWEIRWLDQTRKTAKTATVSYTSEALKSGPEFYRTVFKQLWLAEWKHPPPLEPVDTVEGFWRGAARMGFSREESMGRVLDLMAQAQKSPERDWVPELAGLLVHACLPKYAEVVSLDGVLPARGATWLAFAEMVSKTRYDALWAPVLFQAGREQAAAAVWQANNSSKLSSSSPQEQGWNLWLRKPNSRDVFVFAASATNLSMAMPMLAYDVRVNGTGAVLAELIGQLVDSQEEAARLHNFAPLFAKATGVGGGHIFNGGWAFYSRQSWVKLLSLLKCAPNDFQNFSNELAQAIGAPAQLPSDTEKDLSLFGFKEVVPLLRLGHAQGKGKLATTGALTARDLLNYGWEMGGWQLGSRYSFLRYSWGVKEYSEPLYSSATVAVEGWMPFFRRDADAQISNYAASLSRLEMVEGLFQLVGYSVPPSHPGVTTGESARLFVKRCWLRPLDLEWEVRALWDVSVAEIPDVMQSMHSEGGSLMSAYALGYLSAVNNDALRQMPKSAELKYSIAESLPEPTLTKVSALFDRKYKDVDIFERAQEYERMYWQNPDSGLEGRSLFGYMISGCYASVRRFYNQSRPNYTDPVGFSNVSGLELFVLGYALNDADLRRKVLEDSRSGSYSDMLMHIWEAAIQGNAKQMETDTRELVDRYEQDQGVNSQGRRLLRFLPLLPALKDPKSPSRREAVEFFGKEPGWTILRFIWIEKYKVPVSDAVVLLGGRENDAFTQLLFAYLEKDKAKVRENLTQVHTAGVRNEYRVLASCLYEKLSPNEHDYHDVDLKPAGAMSIRQAVLQKLKAEGRLKR